MINKRIEHIFKECGCKGIVKCILNVFFFSVVIGAIYTSFSVSLVQRSLWLDEAMFAYSLSERSLSDLTSDILSWHQSAPVTYLYIVKIITLIFGNSEFTLRIWSFVMYVLMIGCSYYILNKILKVKFPLLGTAFISNLAFLIYYSNEYKPYMSDCFFVLFTIIIYYLYQENKVSKLSLVFVFAVLVWSSNPSCFFIASILLYEFIENLRKRDYLKVKYIILCGIIVGISFIAYYFYWLKPEIDTGFMADFWKDRKFPLIPSSLSDISVQRFLLKHVINKLGEYYELIFMVVLAGGLISFFVEKNRYINIIYGGIVIVLFASMLGFYPFQDRLCLFMYPLMGILFYYYLNKLYSTQITTNIIVTIISVLILFSGNGISDYADRENIRKGDEEINLAIEYLEEHIKEKENLYIYYWGVSGFCYKNKYNKYTFGPFNNHVILGKGVFDGNKNQADINVILDSYPIYILATYPDTRLKPLLDTLRKEGTLKMVYDKYNTHVYYYTK